MTQALLRGTRAQKMQAAGAALLLALALAYLMLKVFDGTDTIDFKYIHLAGALWGEGFDPYSAAYAEQGEMRFQGLNRPEYLFYPPHWWAIATGFAQAPYETAGLLWRIVMAACMIGGCFVLHRTVIHIAGENRPWRTWAMLVFAGAMSATAIALSLGQTSCLLFLGVCLYVHAFVTRRRGLMVLALVIVWLKPNVGLALSLFLVPGLFWWPALIGGALAVVAASLPALLPHGPIEVIRGYLHALSQWEALAPNQPWNITGLRHLAELVTGAVLPGTPLALAASALALGLGALLVRRDETARGRAAALIPLIALLLLCVPMHSYDMVLLIVLIALGVVLPGWAGAVLALALLAAFRANNLETLLGLSGTGGMGPPGTTVLSLAVLAIVLVSWAGLRAPRPRSRTAS